MNYSNLADDLRLPTDALMAFVLAGRATLTVESVTTGQRFTFRVEAKRTGPDKDRIHFVSVLTGSDNTKDYTFIGTLFDARTFKHSMKSALNVEAPSVKAWTWFWSRLSSNSLPGPDVVRVHHMGACGRCGKALTTPESIRTGLGPKCAARSA